MDWFLYDNGLRHERVKLNYFRGLCEKITQMCTYFKTKTDVAQNLIHVFFLTLAVRRPFHRKDFK